MTHQTEQKSLNLNEALKDFSKGGGDLASTKKAVNSFTHLLNGCKADNRIALLLHMVKKSGERHTDDITLGANIIIDAILATKDKDLLKETLEGIMFAVSEHWDNDKE